MKIKIKLGTMPAEIYVTSKRTKPKVGEFINVKEDKPGYRWLRTKVDMIKITDGHGELFYLSLW